MKTQTKVAIGILAVLAVAGVFLYWKVNREIDGMVLKDLDSECP